jgi:hypothetical protein
VQKTSAAPLTTVSDQALLDRLQRAAFAYLETYVDPETGLVADTSRVGSPASIAVVGFALSCYPIAVERGWMLRAEAAARTLRVLRFFADSPQSEAPDASGHRGFYYHFLDMHSGRRVWNCELSIVDTALLCAGMLLAGGYFAGDGVEVDIRAHAEALYRRIDWAWARDGEGAIAQGWKPECGFLNYGWQGYNEGTIVYLLGMGSPSFPLPVTSFAAWTSTYQWENLLDVDVLYSGPLFTHLFAHAWIDYRGIRDAFMREKRCDYFENTRRTIAVHREYGARNPHDFVAYDRDLWGITAGDGPSRQEMRGDLQDCRVYGYMARGAPYGPDDGTLAPWAMLATAPFGATEALRGTRRLLEQYPQVCPQDRFVSGCNPTCVQASEIWLSDGWYGLDQGLLVMMLENLRSGLPWRLMRESRYLRAGLLAAGFTGGWLAA